MPMVELKVSGCRLSDSFKIELEKRITSVLQDTISTSFAIGLGWGKDDPNHGIAKDTVKEVMPGWTMINVEECVWAWGGVRKDDVVVRLQTFVMQNAVSLEWRRAINTNLYKLMKEMFSSAGNKLKIFNTCVEGEVTMYLPPDKFYGLLQEGETRKQLDVGEIVNWMTKRIKKNIELKGAKHPVKNNKRINYYQGLSADYSKPNTVDHETQKKMIALGEEFASRKLPKLPSVTNEYNWKQIEKENREWWPTHCEALRQGRGDILTDEYRDELVYFCQDGPYYGLDQQKEREKHWWALLAQPGVTMTWPIVMFHKEFVHFEWACMDDETHETIAKGTVCWVRRGHLGGCYFKSEQLTFYRDVFAPESLLNIKA